MGASGSGARISHQWGPGIGKVPAGGLGLIPPEAEACLLMNAQILMFWKKNKISELLTNRHHKLGSAQTGRGASHHAPYIPYLLQYLYMCQCKCELLFINELIIDKSNGEIVLCRQDQFNVVRVLRVLRVLRPLRAINRAKGLKVADISIKHF